MKKICELIERYKKGNFTVEPEQKNGTCAGYKNKYTGKYHTECEACKLLVKRGVE